MKTSISNSAPAMTGNVQQVAKRTATNQQKHVERHLTNYAQMLLNKGENPATNPAVRDLRQTLSKIKKLDIRA
jgi:hypothetical protein